MKWLKVLLSGLTFIIISLVFWWQLRPADERDHGLVAPTNKEVQVENQKSTPSISTQTPQIGTGGPDSPRQNAPAHPPKAYVFGLNGPVRLEDVPEGRFKDQLLALPPPAQANALRRLGDLRVPLNDLRSLNVDQTGQLFYHCAAPTNETFLSGPLPEAPKATGTAALPVFPATGGGPVPVSSPPALSSRPGASRTIYLDFNGHAVSATAWNNSLGVPGDANYRPAVELYQAKTYDTDGNPTLFSDAEQFAIMRVWERVAEDFRGFDVNVTTVEPGTFSNSVGRILITQSIDANGLNMPAHTASGVAYLGVFGTTDYATVYSPAFVYYDRLFDREDYIAEVASHEIGHNLSLSHDGTIGPGSGSEYYTGHGFGETSWGPIMGAGFNRNVSQWSKGEYYDANNTQDDIEIIAGHLAFAQDDHDSDESSATPLVPSDNSFSGFGVIGSTGDRDFFSFSSEGIRLLNLTVAPYRSPTNTHGGNLDVKLELYSTGQELIADNSSSNNSVTTGTLAAVIEGGTYFLVVSGAGAGSPSSNPPTGYTNYASFGSYSIVASVANPIAPYFASQPLHRSIFAGQSASFSVAVGGNPNPTLKWQRLPAGAGGWEDLTTGSIYSGVSSANLGISAATGAMNGDQFRCVVENAAGTATSTPALLLVSAAVAPSILNLPDSLAVRWGESMSVSPSVAGTEPISYQWEKNGTALPGATSRTLSFSSVTSNESAVYVLKASNFAGNAVSNGVQVSVSPASAPQVRDLPSAIAAGYGESFGLYPSVTGTPPFSYQWYKDGLAVPGATSQSYSKGSITIADAGQYVLTATNVVGTATSDQVAVIVNPPVPPSISLSPSSISIGYGQTISIFASYSGTHPISFQWNKDGVALNEATSSSFRKSGSTPSDSGRYSVTATNAAGSTSSSEVLVVVNSAIGPTISMPGAISLGHGASLYLSPSVIGSSPITFQWRKDGVTLAEATSSTYFKSYVTAADSGSYTLTATNSVGSTTSKAVQVTIAAPVAPSIVAPAFVSADYGGYLTISANVSGTPNIIYQWKKDGVLIPNATSSTFSKSKVTASDAGAYILTATNLAGTAVSNVITVSVNPPVPPQVSAPALVAVNEGGSLYLSPSISGTQPMTYEWIKDDVVVGVTSSSYSKNSVTPGDAGLYKIVVTNIAGSVTSTPITVVVNSSTSPSVSLPTPLTFAYGSSINIRANVRGSQPMAYEWRKNGILIPGASTDTYYKYSATEEDIGEYTLTVSNSVGSAVSNEAAVAVSPPQAPVIVLPQTILIDGGSTLSISAQVTGTSPMVFEWRKNGLTLFGEASAFYSRSGATASDSGQYTLTAINVAGATTSSVVEVIVNPTTAPRISPLPATVVIDAGSSLSLAPTVTGSNPMSFQWRKDGEILYGANSQSLYKGSMLVVDGGEYTLTASNVAGEVTSSAVEVIVNPPVAPSIFNVPETLVINAGDAINLSPGISGTRPIGYQWRKDGVLIANGGDSYYKGSATVSDSGSYTLTASNLGGAVTSPPITVVVNPPFAPVIFNVPETVVVDRGGVFNISPSYLGTEPMSFQWRRDGILIIGANHRSYSKSSASPEDAGLYTVTASNMVDTVTSSAVQVIVNPDQAPIIYNLPPSIAVDYGSSFYLAPTVSGTEPMTFQWRLNGDPIVGALNRTYSKNGVTTADSGLYTLTATNAAGSIVGPEVQVVVKNPNPPSITQQPASVATLRGYPVAFQVVASGSGPLAYQWSLNGEPLIGATAATLSINSASDQDSGSYTVRVTGPGGEAISLPATLTLTPPLGVVSAAGGGEHSMFVRSDGSLWGMGQNARGEIGDGTAVSRPLPILVSYDVVAVSTGGYHAAGSSGHSLFIKIDGSLWAAGNNQYGKLGDGTSFERRSPVKVGSDAIAVAAGGYHSAFIKADGGLWAMGGNFAGQLGDGSYENRALPVLIANEVVAVAAGAEHTLFIDSGGNLWATGGNAAGQLGDGTTSTRNTPVLVASNVVAVAAGLAHSLFLKSDGSLWGAGRNTAGQIGDGTTHNRSVPIQVAANVVAVAAGADHSLFVKSDGTLWGMGVNYAGQLGDGSEATRSSPVHIADEVFAVSAGGWHSFFVKNDGALWGMGYNVANQLGIPGVGIAYNPVEITGGPLTTPSPALGVVGSEGLSTTEIRVAWQPVLGAAYYEIWRNTTDDLASASKLAGRVSKPVYHDISIVPGTTYYYWIKAVNATGAGLASAATTGFAAVMMPPSIIDQPQDQTVPAGEILVLSVEVGGTAPFEYQWKRDGTLIVDNERVSGASTAELRLSSVRASDGGSYSVEVSNSVGSAVSSAIMVSIQTGFAGKADFNGDEHSDLLWQNMITGERGIWLMEGISVSDWVALPMTPVEWIMSGTGDFDQNGSVDIVWSNSITGVRGVWLMDNTAVIGWFSFGEVGTEWSISGVGDFDGNGSSDIAWTNLSTGSRGAWLMDKTAIIGWFELGVVSVEWVISGLGDFDRNGSVDIVWTNTETGTVGIWLMERTTFIGWFGLGTIGTGWRISGVEDFDGNGSADIVWTNTANGDRGIWLMVDTSVIGWGVLPSVPIEWKIAN